MPLITVRIDCVIISIDRSLTTSWRTVDSAIHQRVFTARRDPPFKGGPRRVCFRNLMQFKNIMAAGYRGNSRAKGAARGTRWIQDYTMAS